MNVKTGCSVRTSTPPVFVAGVVVTRICGGCRSGATAWQTAPAGRLLPRGGHGRNEKAIEYITTRTPSLTTLLPVALNRSPSPGELRLLGVAMINGTRFLTTPNFARSCWCMPSDTRSRGMSATGKPSLARRCRKFWRASNVAPPFCCRRTDATEYKHSPARHVALGRLRCYVWFCTAGAPEVLTAAWRSPAVYRTTARELAQLAIFPLGAGIPFSFNHPGAATRRRGRWVDASSHRLDQVQAHGVCHLAYGRAAMFQTVQTNWRQLVIVRQMARPRPLDVPLPGIDRLLNRGFDGIAFSPRSKPRPQQ